MRLDKNSLQVKILIPVVALIAAITLVLFLIVQQVSENIVEDYHRFSITTSTNDVRRIIDAAIEALTASNVLDKPIVVEAKKKSVIEAIRLYWANNGLDGIIAETDGQVLATSFDPSATRELLARHQEGHFIIVDVRKKHIHGYGILLSPWQWHVITLARSAPSAFGRREVVMLLPIIVAGSLLMAAGVLFVLKRVVQRPVENILHDLAAGREIGRTAITEFDTIGGAINDALARVLKKTEQCQLLHNLAVSIHENLSIDEVLRLILDRSRELMKAELAAVALYDEQGRFKKILTRGVPAGSDQRPPEGKGILDLIRQSGSPLRIDDVPAHPAFSGGFPEGHPVVRNLLGYPFFEEGKPVGVLYFGNKPGGFTEEDEMILRAISADAAIAIAKAERLSQLRKFKEVIDSSFDVVMITDQDGRIQYANTAFETITGHDRRDIIGKGMGILKSGFHGEDFYQAMWDTIRAGKMWRGEFINKKKDGSIYYSSAIIYPIQTDRGVNYISIQRDITQEKRLYEQLLRAQKMEAIGTLAGGIAHDFNNLLTGILGYADILLARAKETSGEEITKPARIIHSAAEKGADLAKKILTITRKEKMETRAVDVNEIIRGSVEFLRRSIPKNIEIVQGLGPAVPLIKADPTQLQQVIMNLCVNARDAMPDGGKLMIETACVGAENGASSGLQTVNSGFVKLSVSDTGMGMDVETQRKIFDPFFTTKEVGRGTGLGLYIVHSVVSNHGGYINLYSEPGQGTRFNIYLPCTTVAEPEAHDVAEDLSGSGTVLVVDDEDFIRELCKDMLEPAGYQVITAATGSEGVNLFRARKDEIALVVLDMVMPNMGGREVFQVMKTIKPDVKVLIFSGYSHNGFAGIDNLIQSGANGFIQKPFARRTLLGAIKKILA